MISSHLIDQFRDVVNENDFAFFHYSKNNNKNLWNCICSAMDWITVAVEYLQRHPLEKAHNVGSIEMYALISSVDIIVEAIEQLHRVIFSTNAVIFSEDRECFKDNRFGQSDRTYFKTIRSCFGAHPVNLDEPGNEHSRDLRRFASWSGGDFGEQDFSVILYSNQPDGDNIFLGINFRQISRFVEKYYNYLTTLANALQHQYVSFCLAMKKQRFLCEGPAIQRLNILKVECRQRLDNSLYKCILDELILIYETPITCSSNIELVEEYRTALYQLIDEINENLQEMNIVDLQFDDLLTCHPHSLPAGWLYWCGKLSDYVLGNGYPPYFWIKHIEDIFRGQFQFSYETYEELFVLVHSALYRLSDQECDN